ncbi:MAG: VCBS repeat-containing protein [Phycisphaerae bacterium]|nr:VCBS repeat-containing protein [Phycisphaerae bacterium]
MRSQRFSYVLGILLAWSTGTVKEVLATIWNPQSSGTTMTEHVYRTDADHRKIIWAEHAGFTMAVDDDDVYDNWTSADDAPQVRMSLSGDLNHLRATDFAVTVRTRLSVDYGTRFHAGLCIAFGANDLLVFGPHGATDLRLRRPGGIDHTVTFSSRTAYLKIKRSGTVYAAWYSSDGANWTLATTTTITATPLHIGTILKTWSTPHSETVGFQYFDITHVDNEPTGGIYSNNVRYGDTDATAVHFVYDLSGIDIMLRIFKRKAAGNTADPNNTKLYVIHGSDKTATLQYDSWLNYDRICDDLTGTGFTYNQTNTLVVAPRFLRTGHPYPDRLSFSYQELNGEEDWILLDVHENFVRERFPATAASTDNKFYIVGHSGGGQFVARFLMGHANKIYRAAPSSPAGTVCPTTSYNWPYGTHLPSDFQGSNPRFTVSLSGAYALPVGMVMGENDNIIDRGEELSSTSPPDSDHYDPFILAYSRKDGAMKWARQMHRASGGTSHVTVYIRPDSGHGFAANKRETALLFLFGTAADLTTIGNWRYSFELDGQDTETSVGPADVSGNVFRYFKFNRFRVPPDIADRRYEFVPGSTTCFVSDKNGIVISTKTYSLTHNATTLRLTVEGETYTSPKIIYNKLRLYSQSGDYLLEEAPTATPTFITERVVGRHLHFYESTGRDPTGPLADPLPWSAIQLNADLTVTNPDTGAAFARSTMRRWYYDNVKHLLYFTDTAGNKDMFRIGDWRWGTDAGSHLFVAGARTRDEHNEPRAEIQSDAIYNPRYFEEWDVATTDFDDDGTTDILDNCPVTTNAPQTDSDGDGIGDLCDPIPIPAPTGVDADDGTFRGHLWVYWNAVTGATHYRVYRNTSDDPDGAVQVTDWQVARGFQDTNLIPAENYCYWVRAATDATGTIVSPLSTPNWGWAKIMPPPNLTASDGTYTTRIRVDWDTTQGANCYRVYRNTSNVVGTAEALTGWQATTIYSDTSALPGVTYYYWVSAAVNQSGWRPSDLLTSVIGRRARDCNGNTVPDPTDISEGTSQDCNENDVPDECDLAGGTSQDCNENGILDECDLKTHPDFGLPAQYPAGDGAHAVVTADFDGDGDVDAVTANHLADTVSLLKNDGHGAFAAPVDFTVGDSPYSVAAADFDWDNDVDLAVANFGSDSVSILLNDGHGAFAAAVNYPVSDGPFFVYAGEVTRTGVADLVVACALADKVHLLFYRGGGAFLDGGSHTVGNYPVAAVATDLNNDSHPDLAVANFTANTVSILRNDGGGSFTSIGVYPVERNPRAILARDFDTDGDNDLAVATANTTHVWVMYNNGTGGFPTLFPFVVGTNPQGLATADLDADGDLDLVAANRSTDDVSVKLNYGNGTFMSVPHFPAGDGAVAVAAADLNGDAMPDLAVANVDADAVSVLFNTTVLPAGWDQNGNGILDGCEIPGDFNRDGHVDLDDLAALVACFTGPEMLVPTTCKTKDFDRDGDVDQSDFGVFQRCFSGPIVPADPNCVK